MGSIHPLRATAALLAFTLSACATSASPTPSTAASPRPLIVDLDMDSSDVMALAYVLNLDAYEVKAITIPGTGIGHCPPGAENARAIAMAVGHPEIPVACGSSILVGAGHAAPKGWRAPADDLYGVTLTAPAPEDAGTAVELISRLLHESVEPVDILTLGPLTNVADLLAADPGSRSRIRRVVAMAGAIGVPGNVEADPQVGSPEWNVWFAPAAAAAVVASGVPVVMVPLDATRDVPITEAFFGELATNHGAAAADITYELLARNRFLTLGGQYFWDPLAAAFLEDPAVLEVADIPIRIGLDQASDLGRTARADDGKPVRVATAAMPARFAELFLAGLRDGPARADPFAPGGPLVVAYDGTRCSASGTQGLRAGPISVRLDNQAGGDAVSVIVALHQGASWQQVEAYAATFPEQAAAPEFADLITIPQLGPGIDSIVTVPAAGAGIACGTLDQGVVTRVVLSQPFEVGP